RVPVAMSYAASLPDAAMTTRSSTINGELEKPHIGTCSSASFATSRDQTTAPVAASSVLSTPVAPNAYTRLPPSVGVARGPAPAFDSQNRTLSLWLQTLSPVDNVKHATTSFSPSCSCVYTRSPLTAKDDQPGPMG